MVNAKYNTFDKFPSKVFFAVRDSLNYQLMRPKPGVTTAELEAAFDAISDEFFVKIDNAESKEYLKLRNDFAFKTYLQAVIKGVLHVIWITPPFLWEHTEVKTARISQLEAINKHLDIPIDLSQDFESELTRVLEVEMGMISNDIEVIKQQMKDMEGSDKSIIFNYYDEIVSLEDIHGRTLDEKMLLPKYVSLVKSATKKIERQKLQQHGGK